MREGSLDMVKVFAVFQLYYIYCLYVRNTSHLKELSISLELANFKFEVRKDI